MPLVIMTANRDHGELTDALLLSFGTLLQSATAKELTCEDEGGSLTAADIEVEIRDRDPKRNIGGEQYDLQVIVFANNYLSRRANLEERCKKLAGWVRKALPDTVRGFVWIRLAPAAFVEF